MNTAGDELLGKTAMLKGKDLGEIHPSSNFQVAYSGQVCDGNRMSKEPKHPFLKLLSVVCCSLLFGVQSGRETTEDKTQLGWHCPMYHSQQCSNRFRKKGSQCKVL